MSLDIIKALNEYDTNEYVFERDEEVDVMRTYIESRLEKKRGGMLYVTGAPGTGKSCSVEYLARSIEREYKIKATLLNAANLKSLEDIKSRVKPLSGKCGLLVVDEIDQLLEGGSRTKRQRGSTRVTAMDDTFLISLYAYAATKGYIVVGISNSLSLLESTQLKLKKKGSFKLVVFAPYTATQLKSIMESRISASVGDYKLPQGVNYFITRVSQKHGDCRAAVDGVRKLLHGQEKAIQSQDGASDLSTTPEVSMNEARQLFDSRFGDDKISVQLIASNLPIHQQLLLCAACVLLTQRGSDRIETESLYNGYVRLCAAKRLNPEIGRSDVQTALSGIVHVGLLGVSHQTPNKKRRGSACGDMAYQMSHSLPIVVSALSEINHGMWAPLLA